MVEKIFIKVNGEALLFCPFCGKKEVYISNEQEDLFSCSNCKQEFVMKEDKKPKEEVSKSFEDLSNFILEGFDKDLNKLQESSNDMKIEILMGSIENLIKRVEDLESKSRY